MYNKQWLIQVLEEFVSKSSETQNCSISVTVPRGTQFNIMPGTSIMLQCPVLYCTEQPAMSWYRYNEVSQMFLILQQEQRHSVSWINESTFVLNFASFYKNDSGSYHCEATMKKQKWKSHVIQVSVQVKNKMNSSSSEHEMNVLSIYRDVQSCNDSILHISDETTVSCLLQVLDGDAVYGNQDICRKATPNPTCNESVTSAHQLKSENQDTLVYATLSHGEPLQKSEPLLETVFSEYATIGMEQ
ncbi:B- and T-lymphocyte attenuator [Varanus komodoensis]|nr:B- and T-lymphocyte attenuator [Varanus komodoensis]